MSPLKLPLLVGCTGLVGSTLTGELGSDAYYVARNKPTWWDPSFSFFSMDVFSDSDHSLWQKTLPWEKISKVVFLAFPTNLDSVEGMSDSQQLSLVACYQRKIWELKERRIPLLFMSSDAVFWGNAPEQRGSQDLPRPLNVYGHLKRQCEILTADSGFNSIVRAVPIGVHPLQPEHGFVGMSAKAMIQNKKISGYIDNLFNPVSTKFLCSYLSEWSAKKHSEEASHQIQHLVSSREFTKFEILNFCLKILGRQDLLVATQQPLESIAVRVKNQCLLGEKPPDVDCTQSAENLCEDLEKQIKSFAHRSK